MQNETVTKSSPALVAVAWLVVLVPAGWGLTYTVQNAMKLFNAPPVAAAPAPAPAATPAPAAAPAAH